MSYNDESPPPPPSSLREKLKQRLRAPPSYAREHRTDPYSKRSAQEQLRYRDNPPKPPLSERAKHFIGATPEQKAARKKSSKEAHLRKVAEKDYLKEQHRKGYAEGQRAGAYYQGYREARGLGKQGGGRSGGPLGGLSSALQMMTGEGEPFLGGGMFGGPVAKPKPQPRSRSREIVIRVEGSGQRYTRPSSRRNVTPRRRREGRTDREPDFEKLMFG